MPGDQHLDKKKIIELLQKLSDDLCRINCLGELCLVGGAVMIVAFNARNSTFDIDGIFAPTSEIRLAAKQVAEEEGLEIDWLNDAVKGFLSDNIEKTIEGMPQFSNLKVYRATDQSLFAMKVMSARLSLIQGEKSNDLVDLEFLVRHLNVRTVEFGLEIVRRFFSDSGMTPNMRYFLSEAIENVLSEVSIEK